MIGRLRGIVLEKQPPQVLLETHGVGYEILMPMTCFCDLPETGQEAVIFTHFIVREDAQLLFGFIHKQKLILFRELIKINGIGPKLALAILSGISAQQFVCAVELQEINALVRLPGVGKKIAERLVVEMKDRFKGLSDNLFSPQSSSQTSASISLPTLTVNPADEAIAALVALGYKPQEASRMVSKVACKGADCKVLIRDALRYAVR